jgi:hypothetical protein
MTDPVTGSVRIGAYALEVGAFTESYAAFEPEREDRNVNLVRDALAEEPRERHTPVEAVEEFQETAETVTRRCERAHELSRAAAEGRLLEPDVLMAEVDSLLGLAERLDRDGRFDEELRLLRALHGLLVLTRRWFDLIRALRRALSAAQEAGDLAEQAWIRHELGSLHLCAGEPEVAAEQLGQALRLQQRLGQATGTCGTRHNLDSAKREIATRRAIKRWPRRLLRLAGVVGLLTLLAVGGTAIARAQGDDSPSTTAPRSTSGTDTTTTSTTGTGETTDSTTTTTGTTGGTDDPGRPDLGDIEVGSSLVDFGPVTVGESAEQIVDFVNAGGQPINVEVAVDGDDAITAQSSCTVAAPDEACELLLRFAPQAEGAVEARVTVSGEAIGVTGQGIAVVEPPRIDSLTVREAACDVTVAWDVAGGPAGELELFRNDGSGDVSLGRRPVADDAITFPDGDDVCDPTPTFTLVAYDAEGNEVDRKSAPNRTPIR